MPSIVLRFAIIRLCFTRFAPKLACECVRGARFGRVFKSRALASETRVDFLINYVFG